MSERSSLRYRWRLPVAAMLLAAALAVTVSACGGGESSADGDGPVKVGALLPLTGPAAFFGPLQKIGLELQLEEAGGEAGGREVEVVYADAGTDVSTALQRVKGMIEKDGVSVIIGPLLGDQMAAILPYTSQKEVPVISLLNQPHAFAEEADGLMFTPQGALADVAKPGGLYAGEELGVKTAVTQAADFNAGEDITAGFAEGLEETGGEVTQEQYTPLTASDFGPYLSQMQDAEALMTWHVGTEQNFIAEYLKRKPLEHTILGYGDALTEGFLAPLSYSWRLDTPESEKFAKAVEAKAGHPPVVEIEEGAYEAMMVVLEALEVTEGSVAADEFREAVLGLELETPAGPVSFNEDGFGIRNIYVVEAQKVGDEIGWVPVKTYEEVGAEG
jgi:branched-chain amino acid transport system substrate-binding protein